MKVTLCYPPSPSHKQAVRYASMVFRILKPLRFSALLCLLALLLVACYRGPVFAGPSLLSVQSANVLSPAQPTQTLVIRNPTRSAVSWSLSLEADPGNPQTGDWFSLNAAQGSIAGGASTTLTLTLTAGLPAGLYQTRATLSYGIASERLLFLGQVPSGVNGTANMSGSVSTDNALISVLGAASLPPATPSSLNNYPLLGDSSSDYVPGQLLVKYKESESASTETGSTSGELNAQQLEQRHLLSQSLSADYQLRVLEVGLPGQTDLLETSQNVEALARQLSSDPRVDYATPNYYLHTLELPDDPQIQDQFALSMVGLPVAWSVETGSGSPVTVAVLDTGFDLEHEDLRGRFLPGYDFCSNYVDIDKSEDKINFACQDADADPGYGLTENIHGTHVTGILAAIGNNSKGITGAAYGSNIKVVPVKIFADNGSGANLDTFTKGMKWAVGLSVAGTPKNNNPARIINLSLGGKFYESDDITVNQGAVKFMQDAVNAASRAGAIIIAATGNSNEPFILSPAASDKVLAVGSVDPDLTRSNFSNYSTEKRFGPGTVDLMAPGDGILSTVPPNEFGPYGLLQGTSMSTPLVSGIAALLLSHEPQLNPEELEQRLLSGAYFDPPMKEAEFGKGVLRADLAFGLPGPGSKVTLAVGGTNASSTLTTTTLDFYGGSGPFTLPNLASGNYRSVALSNGAGGQLVNSQEITLQEGEAKTLSVQLARP